MRMFFILLQILLLAATLFAQDPRLLGKVQTDAINGDDWMGRGLAVNYPFVYLCSDSAPFLGRYNYQSYIHKINVSGILAWEKVN